MTFELRPLLLDDFDAYDRVVVAAMAQYMDPARPDTERRASGRARMAHFCRLHPDGSWLAVDADGEAIGVALAMLREGLWGLSLLAVHPDRHAAGTGGALLARALETASAAHSGIIVSSEHPAAMRAYARAGFELRPAVQLAGVVDRRGLPAGLRSVGGSPELDTERCDAIAREVRGAPYAEDLALSVDAQGCTLLVCGDDGFALQREGSTVLLCARSAEVAADLLLSALALTPPGGSVEIDHVTAGQDWAVRAGLDCRLALSPIGPLYTRGRLGTLAAYIPSGAYL